MDASHKMETASYMVLAQYTVTSALVTRDHFLIV